MRDLGKASTMVAAAAMVLGLVGCGQGAAGERGGEALGYVIVDRAAREAGVRIEGVRADDAVLPVEVGATSRQTLIGPSGRVPLDVHADEIVYVRGREARLDRGALDAEVARDRLAVVGPESAARALAEEVGGVVDARDGRFVVVAPEALGDLARAAMPEGLEEVVPVVPGDAAGRPAFASALQASLGAGEREALRRLAPHERGPFELSSFVKARLAEPADELLPEVVDCPDPIAGTWVSREHYPEHHDWYRFELIVTRDAAHPDTLQGTIVSRSWSGSSSTLLPTSCTSDEGAEFDWTVRMSATGLYDDGRVSFDGMTRSLDATRCGPSYQVSRYNQDHFTGKLIEGGRFLQAVNNDGDRAVDEPHVFRRISCH
ncbi:hypothetical protein A7982_13466 [Minicystis rosea]|nr:hypothetical protein A7982_13466 [Minicystis rosea]